MPKPTRSTSPRVAVREPGAEYGAASVMMRKLRGIQDGGVKATDIAQLTGTRTETVSRWNSGRNQPQGATLHRVLELEFIVQRLGELYAPEETRLWIFSRHKALNNERPADLIQQGRTDEVIRAIDQLADSVYL